MRKKENKKSVGAVLKEEREKARRTPEELSYYLGVDISSVYDWEAGVCEPSISQCMILSRLYGISLEEMIDKIDLKKILTDNVIDNLEREVWKNRIAGRWYN